MILYLGMESSKDGNKTFSVKKGEKIYCPYCNSVMQYYDYCIRTYFDHIELEDGEWCAFEIKLGAKKIDEGAENLNKVCSDIVNNGGKAPGIKCVICGLSNAVYKRQDGIFVIPITALKN